MNDIDEAFEVDQTRDEVERAARGAAKVAGPCSIATAGADTQPLLVADPSSVSHSTAAELDTTFDK